MSHLSICICADYPIEWDRCRWLSDLRTPRSVCLGSSWRDVSAVPIRAAAYLFGSGLFGVLGMAKHRKTA